MWEENEWDKKKKKKKKKKDHLLTTRTAAVQHDLSEVGVEKCRKHYSSVCHMSSAGGLFGVDQGNDSGCVRSAPRGDTHYKRASMAIHALLTVARSFLSPYYHVL